MADKKIKILIVDDEKDICDYEKSYFERRNFKVITAQSGRQALLLAKKNKPDIALIDIHMSKGIGGIEILQGLLKAYPQCRCVMATWDKEKALEAKELGAVGILLKPTKVTELEQIVNKIAKKI